MPTFTTTAAFASVKKRDGRIEPFETSKILSSIGKALLSAHFKDQPWAEETATIVIGRLNRTLPEGTIPTTEHIAEVVQLVLIEKQLAPIARQYLLDAHAKRAGKLRGKEEPRYGGDHGLVFRRYFTRPGRHPFDDVAWEFRTAEITNEKGEVVFKQENVEVPAAWSQTATNIVVQKYFRGQLGAPDREKSAREVIGRVAGTMTMWGRHEGYFRTAEDADTFEAELTHLLINQKVAFNSPVWFNMGIVAKPQSSACQPAHALVSTPQGFIPIGNIVEKNLVGLEVFDSRGTTKVVATKSNGRKKVYRVNLGNGSFIEATGDHLVRAVGERRTTPCWVRVDALQSNMRLHLYPHRQVSVPAVQYMLSHQWMHAYTSAGGTGKDFSKEKVSSHSSPVLILQEPMTPEIQLMVSEAALAGWLQADGFVGQYHKGTNRSLTMEFQTATEAEFVWVQQHLKVVFPHVHQHVTEIALQNKTLRYRKIRLYGECLRPYVEKWNLLERGVKIRASQLLYQAPQEVVVAYLKSVFQADGYITLQRTSSVIAIDTISGKWMEDVQLLLLGLGIYARRNLKRERRDDRHDLHHVHIGYTSERRKFADMIGFIDPRKQKILNESVASAVGHECPDLREEVIRSIVDEGEQEVYDIQTQSGEYLSHHVVVHNCFINSVDDDMRSIMSLATTEVMLFKYGSGAGSNLSKLRSSRELLSQSAGKASGPVSFMKIFDAGAGVTKSGGRTRRAAKMVILNMDHPDIVDFIECKSREEKKAWALIEAGYDPAFNSDSWRSAYGSVFFQNANHSVRISDTFMQAFLDDGEWQTKMVTTGAVAETFQARDLMRKVATAAWECGDPGVQFDDIIQRWNPTSNSGRINATNPCAEFVYLDDTSCNLLSINLMKFCDETTGVFDVTAFKHAAEVCITAMEIVVPNSSYPTPAIEQNSHDFRPLGIGYANLGAMLMSWGLPYDSDEARNVTAAITSLMSGWTYRQSAIMARDRASNFGPFAHYEENREPFLRVIAMHRRATYEIAEKGVATDLLRAARESWDEALDLGKQYGYRNAQISVLAPTGTISFLMDCDTTGIEPDIALVKYKWLVGGGMMKLVNQTVPLALKRLGYSESEVKDILAHIDQKDTIEGAPHLKDEHLAVFDCAFKASKGTRYISHVAHVKMMAVVAPFISGSVSKTVNMPEASTVEDIMETYVLAWKLGVKCMAIYRDGCKKSQPLTTSREGGAKGTITAVAKPQRRRLSDERRSITHKFSVASHDGYVTVGLYDDGAPGEIFIRMAKQGSTISGLMDAFATSVSIGLQYGVPLRVLVDKFAHVRFEPAGMTPNPNIRIAKSIVDYIFRWLAMKFLPAEEQAQLGIHLTDVVGTTVVAEPDLAPAAVDQPPQPVMAAVAATQKLPLGVTSAEVAWKANNLTFTFDNQSDAPPCDTCGAIMVRNASCYKCLNCGSTSGCS